ncbi:AfsR/SARP family transcriptional regulator [Cellulomonas fengjieae]|uniref:Winged helix-turn-helix domain-containing protein n=1 Tax=Cellulomonas fengjieae TaxID=2819978 RepID=A0ABS3SJP5_9CELL|nr:BTAD domain-containing putative transcriptional regulator [Cellulomonas fengjieae]MBO3085975.1 winged helix-turn-helix domain-containing protein [Cellulomonas fengjieae]QVI65954.1 winged helix-turn-helix domain-containing protein [Cellulomonas fengjieae]
MDEPLIRVLGPIEVEVHGVPVRLSRSRHRELLALLVVERGGVVSTSRLVDELWDDAPAGAVGAVRTFVGELRRLLEPDRPPRTPPAVLVTVGTGYGLRLAPESVDLWGVERALAGATGAGLDDVLAQWRGTPFDEFADRPWALAERARLAGLHADAVERLAESFLATAEAGRAVPLLHELVATDPWRENAWRLLALALYRDERRAEALQVLRRARRRLVDDLGLDPAPRLAELERAILRGEVPDTGGSLLLRAATAHAVTGARAQVESATALLPGLAVSGGLGQVGEQRLAAIAAAEELGDPDLTARVIGGFDVPGVWTRPDDPVLSAALVAAASRMLPSSSGRTRARLLATVAMESRGTADRMAEAREAERLARSLGDPQLLCFALAARAMQCFETAGRAAQREEIAAEIIATATTAELPTYEIHGRLTRMQALCALDRVDAAAVEADAVDALAARHDRPLASVFTAWFRRTLLSAAVVPPAADEMPGFAHGIDALARLTSALRAGEPLPDGDLGPYEPWARPLLLAHADRHAASTALDRVPDPPRDLLLEVAWCLVGRAALAVGHRAAGHRVLDALRPAVGERAAGSGVVDLGPVAAVVDALTR